MSDSPWANVPNTTFVDAYTDLEAKSKMPIRFFFNSEDDLKRVTEIRKILVQELKDSAKSFMNLFAFITNDKKVLLAAFNTDIDRVLFDSNEISPGYVRIYYEHDNPEKFLEFNFEDVIKKAEEVNG